MALFILICYSVCMFFGCLVVGIYYEIKAHERRKSMIAQAALVRQAKARRMDITPLSADEREQLSNLELQIAANTKLLRQLYKAYNSETDPMKQARIYSQYANLRVRIDGMNKKRLKLEGRL